LERVVVELAVDGGIDRDFGSAGEHHGVAVGRRADHSFGADRPAGPGTVVHEHLLPEHFGELLREDSAHVVGTTTRGKWDDQPNLLGREAFTRRRRIQGERQRNRSQEERKRFSHWAPLMRQRVYCLRDPGGWHDPRVREMSARTIHIGLFRALYISGGRAGLCRARLTAIPSSL